MCSCLWGSCVSTSDFRRRNKKGRNTPCSRSTTACDPEAHGRHTEQRKKGCGAWYFSYQCLHIEVCDMQQQPEIHSAQLCQCFRGFQHTSCNQKDLSWPVHDFDWHALATHTHCPINLSTLLLLKLSSQLRLSVAANVMHHMLHMQSAALIGISANPCHCGC